MPAASAICAATALRVHFEQQNATSKLLLYTLQTTAGI
jgi:hypothetical protein